MTNPARVLVVDDQNVARGFFEMHVNSSAGYTLAGSLPAAELAPEFCDTHPVDLVLMDVMMRYGTDMVGCLPYFEMPLLHTRFHFMHKGARNGLENQSWSIYQFDKEDIVQTPIDPFKKPNDE